jgi:peptidoglycan/xylan/chitin deacetylase (PgdA/CDA1 family)
VGSPSRSSRRVRVLAYHAIADPAGDPGLADFCVPPERFAEQVDGLRRRGWSFIDLDACLAGLRGEEELPPRPVLLTFDDAYADLLTEGVPILVERGIPAVVFAVSDHVGGTNTWARGAGTVPLLDAAGLRELAANGIEVGAHTATHPALPEVPPSELEDELLGAGERLQALGLPRPRAFSYPFGLWNGALANAVRAAGYEVAFTVDRGVVGSGSDPYALPRHAVHAGDSGKVLHLKLTAAGWPILVRKMLRGISRLRPTRRR